MTSLVCAQPSRGSECKEQEGGRRLDPRPGLPCWKVVSMLLLRRAKGDRTRRQREMGRSSTGKEFLAGYRKAKEEEEQQASLWSDMSSNENG